MIKLLCYTLAQSGWSPRTCMAISQYTNLYIVYTYTYIYIQLYNKQTQNIYIPWTYHRMKFEHIFVANST